MTRETAQQIEAEAARWASLSYLDDENLDKAALSQWLSGDSRRRGAFLQAQAAAHLLADPSQGYGSGHGRRGLSSFGRNHFVHSRFGKSAGLAWRRLLWGRTASQASYAEQSFGIYPAENQGFSTRTMPHRAQGGRRMMMMGMLALGIIFSTAMGGYFLSMGQQYATDTGEIRRLPLQDGSMAIINTQSEMQLSLSETSRDVRLHKGEAWFKVAHDRARPFTVTSGNIRVRALGTAFSVRKLADGAQIIVNEGVVEVWAEGAAATRQRVAAGSALTIAEARPTAAQPVASNVALDLMWREGKVDLAGRSLGFAVAEFNRYNHRKLVLGDAALAGEKLHGIFNVNDPVQFAMALRDGLEIPVDLAGNSDIILGCCEAKPMSSPLP